MTLKREFERFLRDKGFKLIGGSKHEKWSNGKKCITVPRNPKGWSIYVESRLRKEVDRNVLLD